MDKTIITDEEWKRCCEKIDRDGGIFIAHLSDYIKDMIIIPIPDRTDIAEVAEKQFKQTDNAIEVGVWRGEFAAHNLRFWTGKYYLCDLWSHRDDGNADKNMDDVGSWNEVMAEAINNTRFARERVKRVQGNSIEVAATFPDGFFDWIYIDTLHDKDHVLMELQAWWPKLRQGGLFSGDDYGDKTLRWMEKFGGVARGFNWGVIEAVIEFAIKYEKQFHVTWMNDKTLCPAWYMIK